MRDRPPALVLAAVLLAAVATGCNDAGPAEQAAPGPSASATGDPEDAAEDAVRDEITALLDRRAESMLEGRGDAFARTTASGPFRRTQLVQFAALQQFPLRRVEYRLGTHDPAFSGDRYRARVELFVQLRGFDPAPVPVDHEIDFVRTGSGWKVGRDRVDASQAVSAPWLVPGVETSVSKDLVVVFDRRSVRQRARITRLAESALALVRSAVPVEWPGKAVVIALSDTDALRSEGIDPAEIRSLGGVAVPAGPDPHTSATRVVLAPSSYAAEDRELLTLLRHELAHVALLDPDAFGVPVWVTEGLAEYTAHQGDPILYLDNRAIAAARRGIDAMPPDGLFHAGEWGVSYGLAWFSMLWLAEEHGVDAPYDLLAAIQEQQPGDHEEVSALLEKKYGVTTDELARRASALIVRTYG